MSKIWCINTWQENWQQQNHYPWGKVSPATDRTPLGLSSFCIKPSSPSLTIMTLSDTIIERLQQEVDEVSLLCRIGAEDANNRQPSERNVHTVLVQKSNHCFLHLYKSDSMWFLTSKIQFLVNLNWILFICSYSQAECPFLVF